MKTHPIIFVWHSVAAILILFSVYRYATSNAETGDTFPKKPIQVIVPYDPGGGTDTFARIIQKGAKDNDLMPQPFVIVNKPGGGTTIGSGFVNDARNDGYTMLCLHEALITATVTGQSPYGPDAFEPVAATGEVIQVILVPENSPYQTFMELMEDARNRPEEVTLGVTLSMPTHFTGIMLEEAVEGTRFRFVSSGGGASRLAALMGGHVDASFFSVSEYIRFKENGLRPLATFGDQRHPGAPGVPTAIELGIDVSNTNLQYWWLPKGTDPAIIDYIAAVLQAAMQTDYVQERLAELSVLPQVIVGDELKARIHKRMESFSGMIIPHRVELPNLVAWTVGGILVFGLGMVRRSLTSIGQRFSPKEAGLRFDLVYVSLLLVFVYVLVMAMGWIPFVWATLVFVPAVGILLTGLLSVRWLYGLEIALLMSFGVHTVFTQVFLIALP